MKFGELYQNYFLCFDSKKQLPVLFFCVWIKRYVKLSHFQICLNIERFRHHIFSPKYLLLHPTYCLPHHCVVWFCSFIMSQDQTQRYHVYIV